MNAIMERIRPEKPQGAAHLGFNNDLWGIIELCWLEDRNARPRIDGILSCLTEATAFWYMRDY